MRFNIGYAWAAFGLYFTICAIGGDGWTALVAMFCGYQWGEFQTRKKVTRHNT